MKRIFQNTLSILNRKEKKKFGALIVLNVFISIIDIASLALLVVLISLYTQGGLHIGFMSNYQWLFNKNSILPISIFLLLFIVKSVFGYWILAAQYNYVYSVASRISSFNLLKYLEGSYADYVHTDSSVYVRKILHQPIEFGHYVLSGIQQIITEAILSFFTIIVILVFNAKLFVLLALVLLPPIIIIAWFTKRKLRQARAHAKTSSEKSLQYLHEALAGYIESNIYDRSRFFTERFSHYQQDMARYLADVQITSGMPSRLTEVFAVLGLFLLVVANKFAGNSTAIEIINIGAFMAAAYKIIPGIVKISNVSGQIKTYEYTITDIIQNKYEEKEIKNDITQNIDSVVFNQVGFSSQQHVILNDFDFEICRGDFVGISGPSGSGKTTFINLLLGFLSQNNGDILFNGVSNTALDRGRYWNNIAYVQQRPFLVYDTIAVNITLGAESNNKKLAEIVQAAGLDVFINQYPEGLNKIVTENGKNISGGQRQRIALARALYKDADLIIIDEPFSELDHQSEQHILAYLKTLAEKGKMIIMITHNMENLRYCNKMYFIGKE